MENGINSSLYRAASCWFMSSSTNWEFTGQNRRLMFCPEPEVTLSLLWSISNGPSYSHKWIVIKEIVILIFFGEREYNVLWTMQTVLNSKLKKPGSVMVWVSVLYRCYCSIIADNDTSLNWEACSLEESVISRNMYYFTKLLQN